MTDFISLAEQWIKWDPNEECKSELQNLLHHAKAGHESSMSTLKRLLGSRMAFGTAGLRGPMGVGYCRMNDLVILQTMQGMVRYLEGQFGVETARQRGVIIGFDHRESGSLSSRGFARICTAVLASQGHKVYVMSAKGPGFVPTPFVAFAVTNLKCAAGIMITASHNPKEDNGFKVYGSNGSQIIPPHDNLISEAIEADLEPWMTYDTTETVFTLPLVEDVTSKISTAYYGTVATLCGRKEKNHDIKVKMVYTAMHGVGCQWVKQAFDLFNLPPLDVVPAQAEPNPAFPTVKFPNPEEKGALDEAMGYANSVNATIIIANDPDADRLAVAEKDIASETWYVFSGNEIGVLLGHWCISKWKKENEGRDSTAPAVLASVVSSRMLKCIAETENVIYCDTLTGFKWLGNKAIELKEKGTPVLFAYEEALGFATGGVIVDKDGISAAAVFAEMIGALAEDGKTVKQCLQGLYKQYGEFVSCNSYVICHDPSITNAIFHRLRTGGPNGDHWNECAGSVILSVKDVTMGYDSSNATGASDLPPTPDAHMIMYSFDNGCTVTLRTSGTEPKIKYYTEMRGAPGQDRENVATRLQNFVESVVEAMIQPTLHGLQRP